MKPKLNQLTDLLGRAYNKQTRKLFDPLASLRLTVWLLGFSTVLVFFGTLDQVRFGIHHTQQVYFESLIAPSPVLSLLKLMFTREFDPSLAWFIVPLPGGFLLGALLLANLTAAHFKHTRLKWSKAGIALTHLGVVLLLISGFAISILQHESQMTILEGQTASFSRSFYDNELAIVDVTSGTEQIHHVISQKHLKNGKRFAIPDSPITLEIIDFFPNAGIFRGENAPDGETLRGTQGASATMGLTAVRKPLTFKQNETNSPTALVEVFEGTQSRGTWLVSNVMDQDGIPPQRFSSGTGPENQRTWELALRFERTYYPFEITLLDFTHEKHPGTELPRNFSSRIRLVDGETGETRETLVYMNHPLRYRGNTFYQASFGQQNLASTFQVVRNPASALPYIAVTLVGLGTTAHFCLMFARFLRRTSKRDLVAMETGP